MKIEEHYQKQSVVSKYEKKRFFSYGGQFIDTNEREIITSLLKESESKKILDLGAGTGRISILLAKQGFDVTSFDQSEEMLKTIKEKSKEKNLNISLMKGDVSNLPFGDSTFDACVSLRVLWHFKNPENIIKEVYRVLKKDGVFIFDLLNKKSLRYVYTPVANRYVYTKLMNKEGMDEVINSNNFEIKEEKQYFIFPYLIYRCSPKFLVKFFKNLENKMQNTKYKNYSSVIYFKVKK
jgi:ubiquinone/menaquinone biosynthesis C-methylase UbiE